MFDLSILEDFCFTTPSEVSNYSKEERNDKPTIPGYQFIQLLDSLDSQVRSTQQKPQSKFLIMTTEAGTGFWLAKNVSECGKNEVHVYQLEEFTDLGKSRIKSLKNVNWIQSGDDQICGELFCSIDCVALICTNTTMHSWFEWINKNLRLRHGRLIVFDPKKALKEKDGRYFMNSDIWVSN